MRKNEPTASRRLVPIDLVDNNGQPYAGTLTAPTLKIAKPGGNWIAANAAALIALTGGTSGTVMMQLSVGECDTSGPLRYSVDVGTARHFDDFVYVDEEDDAVLAALATLTTNVAAVSTAVGTNTTSIASISSRLPTALDVSGNIKAAILSLGAGSISSTTFAAGAITNTTIADGFLTSAKVADGFLTNAKIADGFLTAAKLATDTITAVKVASDVGAEIAAAVGALVVDGSRTVKGTLARLSALSVGRATGLLSSVATFFLADGVTKAFEFSQDTGAGTRVAASTVNGD
jgi:hypothetical protein